ncbi:immunoglobulin domain-containing protein [Klebsiella pneumoniae]|uniref:immunoglobulin domain-containing protein n=1 Tax=Klebsiella pneumoniae TaxID=573 RepID=UPI001CC11190|nr:immunoglobulin domain-containing protein [Klebsiella pneumoniae]EKX7637470.1 phage tail protein [Klebsiella pneumoniae]ELA1308031.1 phage tail protein [Klebsiella pneumoniae]MBZ1696866.1 phage tail protein [Klebsiella pneumoniae]HDZ2531250.1 phage tail protein [Klebsiella pneumoniae]HDZ2539722.1 phage tail protein [Klebsiella pneumoniae]
MTAQYEKTLQTQVLVSSGPVTAVTMNTASYLDLAHSIKQCSFTAGQKQDIDVTTLGSSEQEMINGLAAASEISMSGNFYRNAAQDALRTAYDNDGIYGFKIIFPSGNGFIFRAEVRQHTWDAQTNGVVAATFSLRIKGKTQYIDGMQALGLKVDLPPYMAVPAASKLELEIEAEGGQGEYTYAWFKDGEVIAAQTAAKLSIAAAAATDAGEYYCVVSDAAGEAITSDVCTVAIE